ncbi:transposase [bacterium]|nr:transposase [bacterium]MBU1781987.1 transposase [bacterium]MBU2600455.1 transposase [bacterium]
MQNLRKNYSPAFKAKVTLEAIKEEKTSSELASQYQVHAGQIRNWKHILRERIIDIFNGNKRKTKDNKDELIQLRKR